MKIDLDSDSQRELVEFEFDGTPSENRVYDVPQFDKNFEDFMEDAGLLNKYFPDDENLDYDHDGDTDRDDFDILDHNKDGILNKNDDLDDDMYIEPLVSPPLLSSLSPVQDSFPSPTDVSFDNTPSDPRGPMLYIGDGSGRGEHESPFGSFGGSTGTLGGLTGSDGDDDDNDASDARGGGGRAGSGLVGGGSLYGGGGDDDSSYGGAGTGGGGADSGQAGGGGSVFGGAGDTSLGGPGNLDDDDLGGGTGTGGGVVNTGDNPGNDGAYDDQTTGLDLSVDDGVDVGFPGKEEDDQAITDDDEVEVPMSPILLDLDGNGIQITNLSRSTQFVVGDDGLEHRTAWAGAGDGVLFYDTGPNGVGDGKITETREYVFTEWDPTARSDFEALRARFDSNNDGKLTSDDALFGMFKVMVTKPDGSQEAQTLGQLGISSIDLTGDTTHIRLPDGSVITGQSTFTMGGVQMTAADVTLMAEAQGYDVRTSAVVAGSVRTTTQTAIDSDGDIAFRIVSVALADGSVTTNSYDDNGDMTFDRTQRITVEVAGNTRTETTVNKLGSAFATGVLADRTVETTVTGTAGRVVLTINRDTGKADRLRNARKRVEKTYARQNQNVPRLYSKGDCRC